MVKGGRELWVGDRRGDASKEVSEWAKGNRDWKETLRDGCVSLKAKSFTFLSVRRME